MGTEEIALKITFIGIVILLLGLVLTKIYNHLSKEEDRLISDFEILCEFLGVGFVLMGIMILFLNFFYFVLFSDLKMFFQ
jgi:hypothetical protein